MNLVHLGLGAFARAHLAEYTQDAGGWGIVGVAPHRPRAGGPYTLVLRGTSDVAREITCVQHVLHAPTQRAQVIAALAEAELITLTVTEKAYAEDAPIIALLREALDGCAPKTVMSLDNLPRNGEVLERLVGGGHRFPCSMVDRVVPAPTEPDVVIAEPFRQWVIEDFDGPRPDWDALFVASSAPHEALKLRLLNGTHSLLAYGGLALGHVTVADAWGDADLRAAAERLAVEDLVPTLPDVPGIDIAGYRATLDERWSNPRIAHGLDKIALDGQQKLPARFGGLHGRWIGLTIAAWLEHDGGGDVSMFEADVLEHVRDWRERFAADGFRVSMKAALQ